MLRCTINFLRCLNACPFFGIFFHNFLKLLSYYSSVCLSVFYLRCFFYHLLFFQTYQKCVWRKTKTNCESVPFIHDNNSCFSYYASHRNKIFLEMLIDTQFIKFSMLNKQKKNWEIFSDTWTNTHDNSYNINAFTALSIYSLKRLSTIVFFIFSAHPIKVFFLKCESSISLTPPI